MEVPVYSITLVEMAGSFKSRLREEYTNNRRWKRILELLSPKLTATIDDVDNMPEGLQFRFRIGSRWI